MGDSRVRSLFSLFVPTHFNFQSVIMWRDFKNAIYGNDAKTVISVATPTFVSYFSDCLEQFCYFNCKFDGDAAVISHLLAMGATFPKDGLHGAVETQRFNLAKALLNVGCDPNAKYRHNRNDTPLDWCTKWNLQRWNWDIIHLLIDAGGELGNSQDWSIQTIIDLRKAARISAIAVIGVSREMGRKDVFRIIARSAWSQRMEYWRTESPEKRMK